MSLLSMVEARLPPGFRFHPRDEELICDYVAPKVAGDASRSFFGCQMLIEVDLNKCEPWDLPDMAQVGEKDWYFFSLKDRKYATGQRANRATPSGYWKATGKDKPVVRKGMQVGMRKTLVFYRGRAPKGKKTEWVMHEFRMESPGEPPKAPFEEDWVLCKVFNKSREISLQPSVKTAYDDTGPSCRPSTIPNLSNSYITFNQTLPDLEVFEQVPCFSSFHPNSEPISLFPLLERNLPTKGLAQRSSDSFLSGTGLPSVWNPY